MWIKFHPYTLELFHRVSPAVLPVAFCCQRNYVMGFRNLTGSKGEIKPRRLLNFPFLKLLLTSSAQKTRY